MQILSDTLEKMLMYECNLKWSCDRVGSAIFA